MKRAILFTAWARPEILRTTLASWDNVREIKDWHWYFSIDPSVQLDAVLEIVQDFISRNDLPDSEIHVNSKNLGVLKHPWHGFQTLFKRGFDFVLRAEDDLCVSDDILEYFDWAEQLYRHDPAIATVHGYTDDESDDISGTSVESRFNPWIWGTWRRSWKKFIRDTWDHNYSTFNGEPGNESGWDWNLDTRIFPQFGLSGVYPKMSRVDNIGIYGVHGTPANHRTAPSFQKNYGLVQYRIT